MVLPFSNLSDSLPFVHAVLFPISEVATITNYDRVVLCGAYGLDPMGRY
jgi:hypothetical protein